MCRKLPAKRPFGRVSKPWNFSLSSRGVTEADATKAGVNQLIKLNVRFLPSSGLKNLVENVVVELEGVYDITGENEGGEKFYKRVAHKLTADEVTGDGDDNTPTPPPSSTPKYTLTVKANNDQYGTVEGSGEYAENAMATLKAIAKSGYEFKQWNDGNTAATRQVTVVADKTYTASFSQKQSEEEGTI